ncbi:porin PorA family protein [Blastococcus tunisiensis]|uniref:DUF3068 domain-containing protein n=1 Tax=Blastococcus tunisiensis TaxID=1798228 RepID=A0A1I2M5V6_9ACTN|nr:porin PorA family protein [Blastococcus sp. DSM 46838]SFF86895.1 Protein of unknown function [Blastococcus sp. DSM 46838]
MRLTRASVVLAVLGVLLIAGAAVVRFVVVPSASRLPADLETGQDFEGTYSGLNPAALAGGAGDLLLQDVPVTASRTYTVDSTDGDTAVITRTVERTIGGQPDPATTIRYAVDRTDFRSTSAPSGIADVVPSEGLVFTLPLDPETDADYRLWDQTTAAAYPLSYEGTSTLAGRTVREYRSVADGPVADPAALDLPTSVTKAQLVALQPVLARQLPPAVLAQLPAVLAQLPDDVPVTYTSETTSTVFADSEIGAPIGAGSTQEITAQLALGATVAVPFSTIVLTSTDESEQAMADDTAGKAGTLNLMGTVLPVALAVLGLALLGAAALLAVRAGRGSGSPGVTRPDLPAPARV